MIFIVALLTIVFLSYMKFRLGRSRKYELAAKLASPREYPFIGHAYLFAGSTEDILKSIQITARFAQENGGIGKIWVGPSLYVGITNPADAEIVLNSCLQKERVYKFMKPWLGDGLVSGPVAVWKRHRRMLMPTFNQKILDEFIDVFWEQSKILIEKVKPKADGSTFNVFPFVTACTLDIICESVMGVKMNAQESMDAPYFRASLNQLNIISQRMYKIWLQPDFIFNLTPYKKIQDQNIEILHGFTHNVISKKRQEWANRKKHFTSEPEGKTRKTFLDLMMELVEDGEKLTDAELREEVDTMTIAGNDTSALVISFTLVTIGSYPSVQEKVIAELNGIFGNSKRSVTKEDLSNMHYLERVIKETMRLYPIVPMVVRQTEKEIKLTSAVIPADTGCIILPWGLHRNKSCWGENVDEFDPDRFLPERSVKRHRCSYIPFSYGPRNCIGRQYAMLSVKTILSTFLRNYKINADLHMQLKIDVLVKPVHGHLISIEER